MVRKPSSLSSVSTSHSKTSSTYPPSVLSTSWDADDEDEPMDMSADDSVPPRPLSIAVPTANTAHGPCSRRRPTLREILANTSEAPWTLAAFMAYLSSNHCLETLEFTMDAGRYKKHYAKMMSKAGPDGMPSSKDREYVQQLWERLVEAYIQPSGTREVNIPSNVRDPILNVRPSAMPPAPETLDPAVVKVYELMEESVLVPFLNSLCAHSGSPTTASRMQIASEESISRTASSYDDRSHHTQRDLAYRGSSPPQTVVEPYSHSYSPSSTLNRPSPSSPYRVTTKSSGSKSSYATSNPARSSAGKLDSTASGSDVNVSGSANGPGMTDDSGSADSPGDGPATPPTSPPLSDVNAKRDSGMWKRLGRFSKAGKKRSDGRLTEEQ